MEQLGFLRKCLVHRRILDNSAGFLFVEDRWVVGLVLYVGGGMEIVEEKGGNVGAGDVEGAGDMEESREVYVPTCPYRAVLWDRTPGTPSSRNKEDTVR